MQDKIYRNTARGRVWVGEKLDGNEVAELPGVDDPRWIKGRPTALDVQLLTISPFYPTNRLGHCVEEQASEPHFRYPNHPPFAGCVAWMPLNALEFHAVPNV